MDRFRFLSASALIALLLGVTGPVAHSQDDPPNSAPQFTGGSNPPLRKGSQNMNEDEFITVRVSGSTTSVDAVLLADGSVSDSDGDPVGIAISNASGSGTFQFATSPAGPWQTFPTPGSNGHLLLGPSYCFRYTGNGRNGEMAFITYRLWDGTAGTAGQVLTTTTFGGTSSLSAATRTTNIPVDSVQDPAQFTTIATQVSGNDNGAIVAFPGIVLEDVDSPADTLRVRITISNVNHGSLAAAPGTTTTFTEDGYNSGIYQATGTASALQTQLRNLRFQPVPNFHPVGTTGNTTLTLTVALASPSAPVEDTKSVTVGVQSVNDAPTVTLAADELFVFSRAIVEPFQGISIFDPDRLSGGGGQLVSVKVTEEITGTGGSFDLSGGAVAFGEFEINNVSPEEAMAALRAVRYTAPGIDTGSAAVPLVVTVTDSANATTTATVTLTVASPTVSSNIRGTVSDQSIPDNGARRIFDKVTITGSEVKRIEVSATLTSSPGGNAITGNYGSYIIPAGSAFELTSDGLLVTERPVSEAAAALNEIAFKPTPNRLAGPSILQFTITLKSASGSVIGADSRTTVQIVPVNDLPTFLSFRSPNPIYDDEVEPLLPFPSVRIEDPDNNGEQNLTVLIDLLSSLPSGTATKAVPGTLETADGSGNLTLTGDGQYRFSGTPAEVTATINQIVFKPTANRLPPGVNETVIFRVTLDDDSGDLVIRDSVRLLVISRNDLPAVGNAPGGRIEVIAGNDILPFANPGITVTDDDVGDEITVRIELDDPAKGQLSGDSSLPVTIAETPEGSGIYTGTGTAADVEAALRTLRFTLQPGYPVPAGQPGVLVEFSVTLADRQGSATTIQFALMVRVDQTARVVTSIADSGPGSLRDAIERASDNDHIVFDFGARYETQPVVTIRLQSRLIIDKNLTIIGTGAERLVLSGDHDDDGIPDTQLFQVGIPAGEDTEAAPAYLHLSRLTLTHGTDASAPLSGGAIAVTPGSTLVVDHVEVLNCAAAQWGGAIDVDEGSLTVTHSLFAGNQTSPDLGGGGGAISLHTTRPCVIANVTFSGNTQGGAGGIGGGALYVENSDTTVPFNVSVTHCTFTGNFDVAGGGSSIRTNVFNTWLRVANCLFADGDPEPLDPSGAGRILSLGGNVADDDTEVIISQGGEPVNIILLSDPSDIRSATLTLEDLADNGGQIRTHALPAGSPARGAGNAELALATDQRDVIRPAGSPDAGAWQSGSFRRLVINEVQFDPPAGSPAWIEIVNPADSETFDLAGLELWVAGVRRHVFSPVSMAPGTGLIVADNDGPIPDLPGGIPVQTAADGLGIGENGGIAEIRTAGGGAHLIERATWLTAFSTLLRSDSDDDYDDYDDYGDDVDYDDSDPEYGEMRDDNESVATSVEFVGGMIPGPATPGTDRLGVPLMEGNAPPIAYDDTAETTEDELLPAIPVLDNDFDADRTDVIRVEALPAQSALGASLSIVDSPRPGYAVAYDPTNAPLLQAIPLGEERIDTFDYVILDYADGVTPHSRNRDPDNPDPEEAARNIARATGTVSVRVIGVNDNPTPAADTPDEFPWLATTEDAVLTFPADDLLLNDTDPDDGESHLALRLTWVKPVDFEIGDSDPGRVELSDLETTSTLGAHVRLTLRADRSLSTIDYDPTGSAILNALSAGETIEDTFAYYVIDVHGAPGRAVVSIRVTGVNDEPVAANDGPFAAYEDFAIQIPYSPGVLDNDSDVDRNGSAPDDVLTVVDVQPVSALGAAVSAGPDAFTYDPTASSLLQQLSEKETVIDQFTYTISDGNGGTSTATVLVRVTGINDRPIANDDTATAGEDDPVTIAAGDGVLANDVDIDQNGASPDDALRALPVQEFTTALGARVRLYADGSFDYLPDGKFEGLGQGEQAFDSFSYTATDDGLVFANEDSFRVTAGESGVFLPVLQNDVNFGVEPLADLLVTAVGDPDRGGTVAIAPDGTGILYTPAFGFVGTETFSYDITAGGYGFCTATVTVSVIPASGPFAGRDDSFTVAPSGTAFLDVLANDLSLPGGTAVAVLSVTTPASGGSADIVVRNGRTVIQYSPAEGFTGIETFQYTASAGGGTSFDATVTVTVPDRSGHLQAWDDTFRVLTNTEDNPLPVLDNDAVPPATTASWTIDPDSLSAPSGGGTVTVSPDGRTVLYTAPPDFTGTETFTYSVVDAYGGTGTALVTVTSGPMGLFAVPDTFALNRDSGATTLPVTANDILLPVTGDPIEITYLTTPAHGTVAWNSSRSAVIYTPEPGFVGTDTFSYEIAAATYPRQEATVTVHVLDRANTIAAAPDIFAVSGDSRRNVLRVMANDTTLPLGSPALRLTAAGSPDNGGTVEIDPTGQFLFYTPATGFIGTETFSYTLADGSSGTGTAQVTVRVGEIFVAPDVFTVVSGSSSNLLDVLANDRRIPGGRPALSALASAPSHGTAVLTDDAIVYTPAAGFTGVDTLTYRVSDDSGTEYQTGVLIRVAPADSDRDNATVIITVNGANDAPVITGTQAFDFLRDDRTLDPFTTVLITEVDSYGLQPLIVTITIDDPVKGTLVGPPGSGFVEGPVGTWTFNGTAADATAAIRLLTFIPTADRLGWSEHDTTTFTISVDDGIAPPVVDSGTTIEVYNIGHQFADNWIFGNGITLSWDEKRNLTVDRRTPFGLPLGGGASWSDPYTGQWLVYADGNTAWNAVTGQVISGANGTLGARAGESNDIPAIIVPKPGGDPRVNLFIFAFGSGGSNEIHLTEVDLSIGPNGSVVGTAGQRITGTISSREGWTVLPHGNGTDFWLVIGNGNAYPVRASGVGTAVSNFHLEANGGSFRYSPDGRRIAVSWNAAKMYIYDFDPHSGKVSSNRIQLNRGRVFFEFSHDGRQLYLNDTSTKALYKYNLSADPGPTASSSARTSAVSATEIRLHTYASHDFVGDMALGPDNRIYIAGHNGTAPPRLHVIEDPDAPGTGSTLKIDEIVLPAGSTLRQGLYHGLRTDDLLNDPMPVADGPFVTGRLASVSSATWTTVTLPRTFASMVVVATPEYANPSVPPVVTRIRNASGNSFEVTLARADNLTATVSTPVHYVVVEEGRYTESVDGIKMEAVKFLSTTTDRKNSQTGVSRSYQNSYSSPVVIGQVMTANDPRHSHFWARGFPQASNPPSGSNLYVGKHIGSDTVTTRQNETIGYIVIEAGSGRVGRSNYAAFVGGNRIRGVDDGAPFTYSFANTPFPTAAVASPAGMADSEGGWPVLFGPSPLSESSIRLAIDEDRIADNERNHNAERVAVLVLGDYYGGSPPAAAVIGTYEAWLKQHFADEDLASFEMASTVWGPDADADADGRTNLAEYAFGSNPRVHDSAAVASAAIHPVTSGGNQLQLTYRRRGGDPALEFSLEKSTDLRNWEPATPLHEIVLPAEEAPFEDVTLTLEVPAGPAVYYRIRTTR